MVQFLHIIAILTLSVAMALSLAHALEFPGKLRLSKEEYLTVQSIYYPGFTYGGITELAGIVLLIILMVLIPKGTAVFWLTMAALAALAAMHAVYWLVAHPINKFWVKGVELGDAGARFFSFGGTPDDKRVPWMQLRDRWEYSHVTRAVLAFAAFTLLVVALAKYA